MSDQLAKQVQTSGTKISKEKLLELLRKSPQRDFAYSQTAGRKTIVLLIPIS